MSSGVTAESPSASAGPTHGVPTDQAHRPVIVIDGTSRWVRWWADLYVYRGALQSLAWRNVRSRYKQAVLGILWAVIQPVVQVGVFTVLFGTFAHAPTDGAPYMVFTLAGLLLWNLFNKIVSEGAVSLVTNQNIITKLFFPRIYLVLAAGASAFLDAAVTLALLVVGLIYYRISVGPAIALAAAAFALTTLFSYGLAALLAAINARWRDVQHTLPFVLQVALLVSPVAYAGGFVPSRWHWLIVVNPLSGLLALFRAGVLGTPLPAPTILITSLALSVTTIIAGLWLFRRSEAAIVDVV